MSILSFDRWPSALLVSVALVIASTAAVPATRAETPHVKSLEGAESPPASIEDVAWITGSWAGTGFGGNVREVWSGPLGGSMLGLYRHDGDDGPSFYELETIVEEGGSLVWKVKHFNPDFTGWETKDEYVAFPLVELGDGVAYFDGLTVERDGPDGLTIYLRVRSGETVREEKLQFTRVPLDGTDD